MFFLNKTPQQVRLELASKLKALRKNMGISQAELAQRSEISLGSLKRFEQSGLISLESLLKIAQVVERLGDFDALFVQKSSPGDLEKLFRP